MVIKIPVQLLWLIVLCLSAFTLVEARELNKSTQLQGVVMPEKTVKLSFAEAGVVKSIVAGGTIVEAGDPLASLDEKKNQALLEQSQAQFRAALSELKSNQHSRDKSKRLVTDQVLSDIALIESEFAVALAKEKVAVARAQLKMAEAALANLDVTAPFAGLVISTELNAGEWAKPGEPFMELVSLDELRISTDLTPDLAAQLQTGLKTAVLYQQNVVGEASVKTIFPVINPASGLQRVIWNVKAKASFLLSGRFVFLADWTEVKPVEQ